MPVGDMGQVILLGVLLDVIIAAILLPVLLPLFRRLSPPQAIL
jgi:predicted RND superfamily exporter protein